MTVNTMTTLNIAPAYNNAPLSTSKTIWYTMHEGTGTVFNEQFANGYDLDVTGTLTNLWATKGSATPNATDIKGIKGASATAGETSYIDSIFNLSTLLSSGGSIYVGFEIGAPGTISTSGTVLHWGRNSATIGGLWFDINGSKQPNINFRGDNDAAGTSTITFGKQISDNYSGMKAVVLGLSFYNSTTLLGECYIQGENSATNYLDISGKTLPTSSTDGITVLTRRTSGASWTNFLGSGTTFLDSLFVQRRSGYNPLLGAAALADMISSPREFPNALRD